MNPSQKCAFWDFLLLFALLHLFPLLRLFVTRTPTLNVSSLRKYWEKRNPSRSILSVHTLWETELSFVGQYCSSVVQYKFYSVSFTPRNMFCWQFMPTVGLRNRVVRVLLQTIKVLVYGWKEYWKNLTYRCVVHLEYTGESVDTEHTKTRDLSWNMRAAT